MSRFTVGGTGAGAVGQSVAALLVRGRWCSRAVIAASTQESAAGLVTDLEDMREITLSPARADHAQLAEMREAKAFVTPARCSRTAPPATSAWRDWPQTPRRYSSAWPVTGASSW